MAILVQLNFNIIKPQEWNNVIQQQCERDKRDKTHENRDKGFHMKNNC